MKKILSLFAVLSLSAAGYAHTLDVSAAYTGSSRFDKVQAGVMASPVLNVHAGLQATWANEHHLFAHPVYSVAAPIGLDFDWMQFDFRPFYYFNNTSHQDGIQNASAFGLQSMLWVTLQDDTVNDLYTHAFVGASFARQKGTVFFDDGAADNRYYSQAAYTLGVEQNFYQAFLFRVAGTAFQYPNGITGVAALRSVMDQQELADTQTLEIVHDLAKYALSARLTRQWTETNASFYVGYRYAEYYTAQADHSVIVGNAFPLFSQVSLNVCYNHLRTVHNANKRDIWQARLEMAF